MYYPEAQIIHYRGPGRLQIEPYRSIYQWHRSYFFFCYRKTFARDYFFLFNWLYYLAMLFQNFCSLYWLIPSGKVNLPPGADLMQASFVCQTRDFMSAR